MTSTVLILNPGSGGGTCQPAIREEARRRGIPVREVGPRADPASLAASADADVLAVGGGDGVDGHRGPVAGRVLRDATGRERTGPGRPPVNEATAAQALDMPAETHRHRITVVAGQALEIAVVPVAAIAPAAH